MRIGRSFNCELPRVIGPSKSSSRWLYKAFSEYARGRFNLWMSTKSKVFETLEITFCEPLRPSFEIDSSQRHGLVQVDSAGLLTLQEMRTLWQAWPGLGGGVYTVEAALTLIRNEKKLICASTPGSVAVIISLSFPMLLSDTSAASDGSGSPQLSIYGCKCKYRDTTYR